MASKEQYSAVDQKDEKKKGCCGRWMDKVTGCCSRFVANLIACPGRTANFLHHVNPEDGNHYFCLLTLTLWCQMICFLVSLWVVSGLFWLMCFYFTTMWPMTALYAFLVCCGLFTLLFIVLMLIDKDEDDGFAASMGCTEAELRKHIDMQRSPDMTWDTFGTTWHIVHKLPLHADNSSDTSDELLKGVCQRLHYMNTEPRWASEIGSPAAVPRRSTILKVEEEKVATVTIHNPPNP